jgi:putative SOS response-associated peptidase YedK
MCGRIALYTPPGRLARQFDAGLAPDLGEAALPHWNVPPTQQVLALVHPRRRVPESPESSGEPEASGVTESSGVTAPSGDAVETGEHERLIAPFRWGLIPWWAKDPAIGSKQFNARAETLDRKPAFRSALAERRCLVLADGFYEWKKETVDDRLRRIPFFFTRSDGEPLAFAGLWETWRDPSVPKELRTKVRTCTIITTAGGPDVKSVHDRMPVVVESADFDQWLDPGALDEKALAAILRPSPIGTLHTFEVSSRVNSVKNEGPELLEGVN